jgi:hypothetical protein
MTKRRFSPEMEKAAREQGFSSAEQMYYFYQQRNRPVGGTTTAPKKAPSVDDAMAWHPNTVFERITQALIGARR